MTRLQELATLALTFANNDVALATAVLCDWTGLPRDVAVMAIDEAVPPDHDDPANQPKNSEEEPL